MNIEVEEDMDTVVLETPQNDTRGILKTTALGVSKDIILHLMVSTKVHHLHMEIN